MCHRAPVLGHRQRSLKRTFDVIGATVGLTLLCPAMFAIGVAVRLTMGGPVLYRQVRVGRDGREFSMPKFRTMAETRAPEPFVTHLSDERITRVGRLLRRTKLDELPQLWSVLRGEMSLVGPRPDVPGYADRLVGRDRRVLWLRPGITGLATLCFRDEEALLAGVPDPLRYNVEVIYPQKTRLNLAYLEHWSLRLDCLCLLASLHPTFERWLPRWVTAARGEPEVG